MMKILTLLETLISSFLDDQVLFSISGESGLGKTTLALQLTGFILTNKAPFTTQCIWIQASEVFPLQRLRSLYAYDIIKLHYLQKNILVTPNNAVISDYSAQKQILSSFSERILPPKVKIIVIDNISHHLRYQLMQQEDVSVRSRILDEFYTNQLFTLIMRCQREHIHLVLIHEVSYNIKEQKVMPFLSQLYERLGMVSIALSKSIFTQLKTLEVQDSMSEYSIRQAYELSSQGFVLL